MWKFLLPFVSYRLANHSQQWALALNSSWLCRRFVSDQCILRASCHFILAEMIHADFVIFGSSDGGLTSVTDVNILFL